MYSPVNVAGPDQRRKQLLAKLGQQAQASIAANRGVSQGRTDQGGQFAAGVGSGFRPSVAHGLVKSSSTQGTNILPSVLARLGISGRPGADEVSQGFGAPIGSPHGTPLQPYGAGSPIPAIGGPQLPAQAVSAAPLGVPPVGGGGLNGAGVPNNSSYTSLGLPAPDQISAGSVPQSVGPGAGIDPNAPVQGVGPGAIPLGGGHYFDPVSGQVIFNPAAAQGGAASLTYSTPGGFNKGN